MKIAEQDARLEQVRGDGTAMPGVTAEAARAHLVGAIDGEAGGPQLVVIGAMHGNEPAGLAAAERVLAHLRERPPRRLRGRLLAIRGNNAALAEGVRYLGTDLNRAFTAERMDRLARGELDPGCPEDREQAELLALIDEQLAAPYRPVIMLDFHTASAKSVPFILIGDNLPNFTFASHFPLPVVLGLEEQIDGALLEHFNALGHMTMGVEGGQHDDPTSIDYLVAVLWVALVAAGMIEPDDVPDFAAQRQLLSDAAGDLPGFLEVRHRHPVTDEDQFVMQPGYVNFQPVEVGERLACDRQGPIHAPFTGLIMLPLYQGRGSDGYFLARELRPLWQRVSSLLRRTPLASMMHLLPGVRRLPGGAGDTYLVDTRVARFYPRELFHLLGFRKLRDRDGALLVSRRRQLSQA